VGGGGEGTAGGGGGGGSGGGRWGAVERGMRRSAERGGGELTVERGRLGGMRVKGVAGRGQKDVGVGKATGGE